MLSRRRSDSDVMAVDGKWHAVAKYLSLLYGGHLIQTSKYIATTSTSRHRLDNISICINWVRIQIIPKSL
jgi:hypothetical protein